LFNRAKLKKLLEEQEDPNSWVLNYITNQFNGSVALLSTSNVDHLTNIMQSKIWSR
jgi:hypothetical protein